MDVKKQLTKIEDSKKEMQRKDLVKALCEFLSKPKNQKSLDQLSKYNFDKTIKRLFDIKEYSLFLELLTSVMEFIPSLTEQFRKNYQEQILNLVIPKIENNPDIINKNLKYFLIATKDLDDISNINHKEYLIYYLFFNVLLKIKVESKIIDLLLKLEKYMTVFQHEIILYILIIYAFINKNDNPEDFGKEMVIIPKIIEFFKSKFSYDTISINNYDIMKYFFLMLLLYSPFKQEILRDFYDYCPNLFMNLIQDIINYIDNRFRDLYINDQEDNNSFYTKYCDKNNSYLININHFFSDNLLESDLTDINLNKNKLYNYFNNKKPLINEYQNFLNKLNLKDIQNINKNNIFKGIIWTISSLLIKNYYISDKPEEKNKINFIGNKTHCLRLFNSIITLFNVIDTENQKGFIKQYLELVKSLLTQVKLFEDWKYILEIIDLCLDMIVKKEVSKENIEKQYKIEIILLNEIFTIIYNLYNKNQLLYCNMENLSLLLHKFNQYLQNEILLCFYINTYLIYEHKNKKNVIELSSNNNNAYINFINNIESLVFNMVSSSTKANERVKNYLMEIIRINYITDERFNEENKNKKIDIALKSKNNTFISKQIEIEKVLEKYLENFFINFGDNEINYAFFNYVLSEILSKSSNIEFVKQIITTLIFNNNANINKNLYEIFNEQILGNLFENTINYSSKCVLSSEKLDFLVNFFYDLNNMNDKSIIKIALKLLKNFTVNSQYEVLFINSNYYNNYLISNINYYNIHSMVVIDYDYNKIQKNKKIYKDTKEYDLYHKNYYAPFTVFQHINLFTAINYHLTNNIKKTQIFENILEFYYLCLSRNLYFLKSVNFKEFLNIILKGKDITKISSSKKSTYYLLKILTCLPYHLHSELSFHSSSQIVLKIKSPSYGNDDIQLLVDPKDKIWSIDCLINLWNTLNSAITDTLNKIFSNEQLVQTIFNSNNKSYNEKNIRNIVDNLMRIGNLYLWCGELNLYNQFDYIYNCIKILKLYLISSINEILYVKKNSLNYNNYNDKSLKEKINSLFNNNPNSFSSIKNVIKQIFTQIFNSLNYKYFNKKYVYFILSLLYDIKELLILFILKDDKRDASKNYKKSFSNTNINSEYNNLININNETESNYEGLNLVFKTIFISMFLSWNYEDKIIDKFDKYLNTNYKAKILNKDKFITLEKYYKEKNYFDEGMQNLLDNISDNLNLYLMEYIPEKNALVLIKIIDEIFSNKRSYREYFFYKMAEWTLKIKKNRNALNIDFRNIYDMKFLNNISLYGEDHYIGQKVLKTAQVFYGNNSLIIINPISITKSCFTIRNPISHMNLIFDSKIHIINNTNINEEIDKELEEDENEEKEEEESDNEKNDYKEDIKEDISNSFSSDSDDFNKNDDDILPKFLRKTSNSNYSKNYSLKESSNSINSLEVDDSSGDIFHLQKKNSENNINKNYEINNNLTKERKSKELDENIKKRNSLSIIKRQRYNSDLTGKYRDSIIFAEQKKKMIENCLKLFSIMVDLTDFKVEQYKWIDITNENNLYNVTKLTQNLDLLPVYFSHNCGLIYYSEAKSDSNSLASYMYFMEKLGSLFDYSDFYAENNKKDLSSNLIKEDNQKGKYIIINQDSLIRINFHVLNLTENDKNRIIENNNIIFIWIDNLNNSYDYNTNIYNDKIKIFFIIYKLSENFYKIQRKYNQMLKSPIIQVIEELFINDFIIDIGNQSSIQLLINMIMHIDILIKTYNKNLDINRNKKAFAKKQNDVNINEKNNEENINSVKNMVIDNQNILISDNYKNESGKNGIIEDKENYLNENDIMDDNIFSFKKRYELLNKLCQD